MRGKVFGLHGFRVRGSGRIKSKRPLMVSLTTIRKSSMGFFLGKYADFRFFTESFTITTRGWHINNWIGAFGAA